jgi:asparagine synthase (glutamine-hydrolysing)
MSGIVGVFDLAGQEVAALTIEGMAASLAHRGPDGTGHWRGGEAALGHCALHTTPEARHETLPLRIEDGSLVLTCDARIDNRAELLLQLRQEIEQVLAGTTNQPPAPEGVVGDSVLILAAYKKWGRACPKYLLGDFAFAVWDNVLGEMFCARDHVGVKPLYYFHAPGEAFVFGSEIKALFQAAGVPRRVSEKRIGEYLISALDDPEATFYERIKRLPAAHTLAVSLGGFHTERYWKAAAQQLELGSDDEYDARFRELLFEAVRCRLRGPDGDAGRTGVGSFLSGGLDSSAVSCVARDVRGADCGELAVFSSVFDSTPECDERAWINSVLSGGGMEPHWIDGDSRSTLMGLESVLWHQDEPFVAPNLCATRVHYQAARESGVRVVLDGHGGDETIGYGYKRLAELARASQWRALRHEMNALRQHGFLDARDARVGRVIWNCVSRRHRPLRVLARVNEAVRKRLPRGKAAAQEEENPSWRALVNPGFAAREHLEERSQQAQASDPQTARTDAEHHAHIVNDALQGLAFETLNKVAASEGVEARYPLWDKRVVEFCLSLPAEHKLRDGWSRLILRRALGGVLPEDIRWRTSKADFAPAALRGLRRHEKERLDRSIQRGFGAAQAYINVEEARRRVELLLDTDVDGRVIQDVTFIVCLETWLQQFQEGEEAAESKSQSTHSGNCSLKTPTLPLRRLPDVSAQGAQTPGAEVVALS